MHAPLPQEWDAAVASGRLHPQQLRAGGAPVKEKRTHGSRRGGDDAKAKGKGRRRGDGDVASGGGGRGAAQGRKGQKPIWELKADIYADL